MCESQEVISETMGTRRQECNNVLHGFAASKASRLEVEFAAVERE